MRETRFALAERGGGKKQMWGGGRRGRSRSEGGDFGWDKILQAEKSTQVGQRGKNQR